VLYAWLLGSSMFKPLITQSYVASDMQLLMRGINPHIQGVLLTIFTCSVVYGRRLTQQLATDGRTSYFLTMVLHWVLTAASAHDHGCRIAFVAIINI